MPTPEQAESEAWTIGKLLSWAAEHFKARGMFEEVDAGGRPIKLPAILPKLTKTPGGTEWAGPPIGQHNQEILGELLGLSDDEIESLRHKGVV